MKVMKLGRTLRRKFQSRVDEIWLSPPPSRRVLALRDLGRLARAPSRARFAQTVVLRRELLAACRQQITMLSRRRRSSLIITVVENGGPPLWVTLLAPIAALLSFCVAAYALLRNSRVAEFQHCAKLSEEIDAKFEELSRIKRINPYRSKLIDILNHYERCAMFANDFRIIRGRSVNNLEQQISECFERIWKEPFVRETFQGAKTSEQTYCELKRMLSRRGFKFPRCT